MAQTRDLGANVGAVGDVVVAQRLRMVLIGEVPVPGEQRVRRRPSRKPLDVHCQKRNIEQDIADPIVVAEGQAIDDPRPVVEAEDVVGQEIAMTVPDHAIGDPFLEQQPASGQIGTGEDGGPCGVVLRENGSDVAVDDIEVVHPVGQDGGSRRHGGRAGRRQPGVERRDRTRHRSKVVGELRLGDQPGQPATVG